MMDRTRARRWSLKCIVSIRSRFFFVFFIFLSFSSPLRAAVEYQSFETSARARLELQMTFDVSTVTVWKLQAVSFRHLIALACTSLPSPIAWRFEFIRRRSTWLTFKTILKKRSFHHLFFLKDSFEVGWLPLLLIKCVYNDDFVLISPFISSDFVKTEKEKFSDPIEKYIKLSLCISNYIYVDLKSHVRFAMRIRLPLLRYSILLTTYMHSTLARRMHITNASSRIARPSQMRGKSSGVAAGSFECHGFSAIVA